MEFWKTALMWLYLPIYFAWLFFVLWMIKKALEKYFAWDAKRQAKKEARKGA